VLALHGHSGSGEEVIRGRGLYWYGRALAELGCVVIAPDIGQHTLAQTNWTLMGERTWDALRCVDYLASRPEVDVNRLAVVGLSLGGETAMYVAALDERLQLACSSGWLTTVANMKQGHCPCWNFPGLEAHFDFADIFACTAPRTLILELGEQERAPGGFPVDLGRAAFAEIRRAYQVLGASDRTQLEVHPGGHVFSGRNLGEQLPTFLNSTEREPPRLPSLERAYLQAVTRELLIGSQVTADDGTVLYTPDGKGNYRALWTRDFAYMVENAGDLVPLEHIPRHASGLVWNDPADPHSPYGFTDTVGKTGELFFESLLYWTACRRMHAWHQRHGQPERALELERRAQRIVEALPRLWDDSPGAFLAASQDCRQLDIWGNAYAVYLDFPLGDRRRRILDFLTSHHDRFTWRGQIRHLLDDEYWQRLLIPIEPDRYQNGAYWATASGWMIYALAQTEPTLARRLWHELLADFQTRGVCECIHGEYRQLPSYVASATNPLAAARRLDW
jgi:dienelactone hydrolase